MTLGLLKKVNQSETRLFLPSRLFSTGYQQMRNKEECESKFKYDHQNPCGCFHFVNRIQLRKISATMLSLGYNRPPDNKHQLLKRIKRLIEIISNVGVFFMIGDN
ncbi:hypothetical protein ILYODFUR_038726 [Ilyodon furcidens]|uniref:Uncharacterized protein n=1 Tax=Ilyodon furcidens TaxID=33524 RepID=A0ABV0U182_9TELE